MENTIGKYIYMTTNTDEKILELLNVVNAQRQEVEQLESDTKQSWRTNCLFPAVFGGMQPINIQIQTEKAILQLQADLMVQADYLTKAAEALGIKFDGKWGVYPVEDWTADFKKRIAIIKIKDKKAHLDELEERLNAIVSPEQRRQLELEEITKSLGL